MLQGKKGLDMSNRAVQRAARSEGSSFNLGTKRLTRKNLMQRANSEHLQTRRENVEQVSGC